jgi:hypothetical protein
MHVYHKSSGFMLSQNEWVEVEIFDRVDSEWHAVHHVSALHTQYSNKVIRLELKKQAASV